MQNVLLNDTTTRSHPWRPPSKDGVKFNAVVKLQIKIKLDLTETGKKKEKQHEISTLHTAPHHSPTTFG